MIGRIKAAVVRSQVEQDMVRMTSRLASAPEQEEVLAILTLRSRLGEITIHHNDGHEHFAELSQEAFSKKKDRTDVGVGWLVGPSRKKKEPTPFFSKKSRP